MRASLFSSMQIRDLNLKNRIAVSPMLTYAAQNGRISDWHLVHLGQFAVGGAGLVFMESTKVDPRGCSTVRDAGLWKDEFIAPLARVTHFIHEHGAAAGIQLGHSGRKARNSLPWEGRAPIADCPGVDHGERWELIGPSPIAHSPSFAVPRAMTHVDIQQQYDLWTQAARRADAAGFDVLEIHGGHGYLLHQFLSPVANKRTDQYGGSLQNRIRFVAELVQAVRTAWPDKKPLFYRTSAVDEAGWSLSDTVILTKTLKMLGVDVIDCSAGGIAVAPKTMNETGPAYGYQVPYSDHIRKESGIKTMAVGLIVHARQAEDIIQEGRADLIAIGREFLHNPHWPLDAAIKLGVDAPFETVLPNYSYWLEKRAAAGLGTCSSTWPTPHQ